MDEPSEWVVMRHPVIADEHRAGGRDETTGDAVVARTALDDVWADLGWTYVEDAPDPNATTSSEPEPERVVVDGQVTDTYADPQRGNATDQAPTPDVVVVVPEPFVAAVDDNTGE